MTTAIVWLRQDLRLADNAALWQASQICQHIIPVFIDDPTPGTVSQVGAASRVWLHHSLHSLATDLQARGSRLLLRRGAALSVLEQLITETGATHVFWNRCYDPATLQRDQHIKTALKTVPKTQPKTQLIVQSFNACLLREPWEVLKADGQPYKVYTPFWKTLLKTGIHQQNPLPTPTALPAPVSWPPGLALDELQLLPRVSWHEPLLTHWQVGEAAALQRLQDFLQAAGGDYSQGRNIPATAGTSRLSPHLHFGELSPRQVVYFATDYLAAHPEADDGIRVFLQEIGWREFAWYLLYHFPHTLEQPLDQRFQDFEWATDYTEALERWQQGRTGLPIVDAGMRELWQTGWMHNRVRMIVASWLTKNLLIPWQQGEHWFRDTLLDADLASNTLGWQWVAGCGADAAPYFRIFNPVLQGEKFDPEGEYVRRWVPELAGRAVKKIHHPRELGENVRGYPLPMADLRASRQRALDHFSAIKRNGKT